MQIDLKALTRKELEKLKADIDKALAKVMAREKKAALVAAERAAETHGFSLAEITGVDDSPTKPRRKMAKKPSVPGKPKYANPDDKKQTWTGKGRKPDWFNAALAAGKTPEDMVL
ncbi:H-NS histone family protein [Cognatiyoonia sp. IB215182]|uniref:H-NS histone family protein n=1 Tax=Cognatiyoonia sp. IB215182 TaxID=3097353 RepID=UPI002A184974|nr:H-NS histone family protein [Cognatiyoonia sp. IB215182]MDX8355771.1 H-NS histone family protein [Cognatiyoonia sp. IB215182]